MHRFFASPWPWLAIYVVLLVSISLAVLHFRDSMLADQDTQRRDWQQWREAAAKQDGRSGPVAREIPHSDEPPMLVLMRDNFPVIFVASILFPALILGFFLMVARAVFVQSAATTYHEPQPADQ